MSNFKSTKTERSESLFGEVIFSYTRARKPSPTAPIPDQGTLQSR